MNDRPLVSILVPIYGVEAYIERCARSLMEQTYSDCEYVFVDDCTPDNSIIILKKTLEEYTHNKSKVKIISHGQNRGLGAARKTGIENSSGKFVTFVDSDDWVECDYIEKLVNAACDEEVDLVISPFSSTSHEDVEHIDINKLFCRILMHRGSPHIWGNLIRRDLMDKYNILPIEGIDMAEDFHFMARYISICSKIHLIKTLIYHYTPDNPESYTKRYTRKSVNSILRSVDTVYLYMLQRDSGLENILNVSALEFYKALRLKGDEMVASDLLSLFSMYLHRRALNMMQRCYLFAIDYLPVIVVKPFSAYYENKYCR